jgi:hypothetical protein
VSEPPAQDLEIRRAIDAEHLRLLRLGYLVWGWTSIAVCLLPMAFLTLFGVFFGAAFTAAAPKPPETLPFAFIGCFYFGVFGLVALFGAAQGALYLAAAKALGERRSTTLIQVAAAISCLGVPWGTLLGILTFHVLSRPSVAACFRAHG